MPDTPSTVLDPSLIYDLFTGAFRPQVVRLALEVDVFTPLAACPADAVAVARACSCSPTGIALLLDALVTMQVLAQVDGRYALSPSAATFLVCSRPSYVGDLILAWTGPEIWNALARAVRRGKPAPFEEYHDQDAWLESYSDWRIAKSQELWEAAGVQPQPDTPRRLLDVACGCAIKSLALAQRDRALHVTGIDAGHVLPAARNLAARLGLSSQAAFVEADLLATDFGADCYDLVLLGQITHYLTPEQNCGLFRRLFVALRRRGTLVLDVPMPAGQPSEWAQIVSLLLWANGGGGVHSFEAYRAWLADAGFAQVTRLGDRWATAVKNSEPL